MYLGLKYCCEFTRRLIDASISDRIPQLQVFTAFLNSLYTKTSSPSCSAGLFGFFSQSRFYGSFRPCSLEEGFAGHWSPSLYYPPSIGGRRVIRFQSENAFYSLLLYMNVKWCDFGSVSVDFKAPPVVAIYPRFHTIPIMRWVFIYRFSPPNNRSIGKYIGFTIIVMG